MRVLKTKEFWRFARREGITDAALLDAAKRAERGLVDADLGGGLIKQRVPRRGEGRSGGYRTLMAYRVGTLVVFLYAFAKSERDNIEADELAHWRREAQTWATMDNAGMATMIAIREIIEVGTYG
jgi:hypothetical protein